MSKEKETIKLGKLTLEKANKISAGYTTNIHEEYESHINKIYDQTFDLKGMELKLPKIPDPNFLNIKAEKVKSTDTDELQKLLSGESHNGAIDPATLTLISNELLMRQIEKSSKPHWNVYAILLLTFIAAAASVIALLK